MEGFLGVLAQDRQRRLRMAKRLLRGMDVIGAIL
jgi:hypothetical protein